MYGIISKQNINTFSPKADKYYTKEIEWLSQSVKPCVKELNNRISLNQSNGTLFAKKN